MLLDILGYSLYYFCLAFFFSCSDREEYSPGDYDSVYITISASTFRRETTISDSVFIKSFLRKIYLCRPVPQEKFETNYIYSFHFKGAKKVTFDLLLLVDGRMILRDSNSIWQADPRFDASSMSEFIDYVSKLKMRRLDL